MLLLSPDESFHYELLRNLSHARYFGADIGEVLEVAGVIQDGNFESFAREFTALASRVQQQARDIDAQKFPVSARDAFFRASTYFRAADFFLHGNPTDARINTLWDAQTDTFDRAINLLSVPGKRHTLHSKDFDIPIIFYAAEGSASQPRPTMILGNGYDGAQEEMLHVCGFAALERGYNVVTYEGPGQPSVRREQQKGFISNWEDVVSPVVDYLETLPDVDSAKIGLLGYSMGGFLAVRAAAFEHRLAAVFAVDGVYDVFEAYHALLPPRWQQLFDSGKPENHQILDAEVQAALASGKLPTKVRWGIEQGIWSFNVATPSEWLVQTRAFTMANLTSGIKCPVWIGDAAEDQFFLGQPEKIKAELGDKGTLVRFTAKEGAANHCHCGSTVLVNQVMFDWFESVVSTQQY